MPASCAAPAASSRRPGRPIRIPIWPTPTRNLRSGDSARERLARVQSLALKAPGQGSAHIESALAVARAALDAQEFAVARNAIRPLLKAPTQRVATLMAEIERAESGDEGRSPRMDGAGAAGAARSGLDRRRLRVRPLDAGVAGERPARRVPVEGAAGGTRRPSRGDRGRRTRSGRSRRSSQRRMPAAVAVVEPTPAPRPPALSGAAPRPPKLEPRAEAIIPLLHVPDDPGPDPAPDLEPEPGSTGAGRSGLRLFK